MNTNKTILIQDFDHSYKVAYVREGLAAYDTMTKQYSEYVGDAYLGRFEVVVEVVIVE